MNGRGDSVWRDVFHIAGKVAVVTGGLGQLGKEFALELLHRQVRVAVFGRTASQE